MGNLKNPVAPYNNGLSAASSEVDRLLIILAYAVSFSSTPPSVWRRRAAPRRSTAWYKM